jgi:lantibiotic modifying enzyme
MIGAVNHSINRLSAMNGSAAIGFYAGRVGIAQVLIDIGDIVNREDLILRGLQELKTIDKASPSEQMIDVISGSAGIIPILLRAWRRFDCNELYETAVAHGSRLLKSAVKSDTGWSWTTSQEPEQDNLTGYSHGVAGIICALLELGRATNDVRFVDAAKEGLKYERHHFSTDHGNWPDFRSFGQPAKQPSYGMAWCHGAPGIGLSRLRVYQLLDNDSDVLAEVEVALKTTLASLAQPYMAKQASFSLCHGLFGNAEFPLLASQILGRPELRRVAHDVACLGIESIAEHDMPWPCGTTFGKETPNLMLGLAGIGYFYLRLHDSSRVPSTLLLTSNTP